MHLAFPALHVTQSSSTLPSDSGIFLTVAGIGALVVVVAIVAVILFRARRR